MAFRKKFESIIKLKPDVLVIQECESHAKLGKHLEEINYNQIIWYGNNPNKGIAILSFNSFGIEINENHNPEFDYIIPIKLKLNQKIINLFAIWAMPHKSQRNKGYVGQIWGAINYYEQELNKESILIGDFNSNAMWDKKRKIGNHTDVVHFLAQKEIHSMYHESHKRNHGGEQDPTLFLLKNKQKPYHMDYCFASATLSSKETTFSIGRYEDWIGLSDHMPIIIDHLNI